MRHSAVLIIALSLTMGSVQASWRDQFGEILRNMQQSDSAGSLTEPEILSGLKEALAKGTGSAIRQLGHSDGFWKNPRVRIPLPSEIAKSEKTLRKLGQGARLDEFQLTLNRAAEQAVPQVADIFSKSIRQMNISDARGILQGPNDAATQYFRRSAGSELSERIRPIVASVTQKVGVTQSYRKLTGSAGPYMQMAGVKPTDLDSYVTERSLDGLYTYIADEEKRIREDPAARTTEILKKVFGRSR